MENIKWCFIKNTEYRYIILSNGRVFSGKHGDYLKLVFFINFHFNILSPPGIINHLLNIIPSSG